jgi:hypothetical protein
MHIFFRTIESLTMMAEIDILCDDFSQAESKLNGIDSLLSKTDSLSDETTRLSMKTKSKKAETAASPALYRSKFYVPAWLEQVTNADDAAKAVRY